jgi:hypothetical protein
MSVVTSTADIRLDYRWVRFVPTTEVGIKNPRTEPVTLRVLRAAAQPKVLHISLADEHRIFAAALMTTTVIRAAPAPGPAASLWLAATEASAPAYPSG